MANKISNFAEGDVNLTALMQTMNAACKGLNRLSLTHMTPLDYERPSIGAGSVVECNGAVYYFEEEEYIEGDPTLYQASPTWILCFIKIVPYDDSNGEQAYAEFLNVEFDGSDKSTLPFFDSDKQGIYDPNNENHRVIAYVRRNSADEWIGKLIFDSFTPMVSNGFIKLP